MEKTPKIIMECICKTTGYPIESIKSKCREKGVTNARHIAAYLLLKYTNLMCAEVGKLLGRNHSTILNSHKVVDNYLWVSKRCHKSYDICLSLEKIDDLLTEVTQEPLHNSLIIK
jgi:chromosomal replication initiation ATPase DnaA